MGRAGRKTGQLAVFILLTPKWTQVKDEKEVQDCITACINTANPSSLLSDSNRPKTKVVKPSPLNQEINASDFSNSGSLAGSKVDENFDDPITNQFFTMFIINAEEET